MMHLGTSFVTAKCAYGNFAEGAFCSDFCCFAALHHTGKGVNQHLHPTAYGGWRATNGGWQKTDGGWRVTISILSV